MCSTHGTFSSTLLHTRCPVFSTHARAYHLQEEGLGCPPYCVYLHLITLNSALCSLSLLPAFLTPHCLKWESAIINLSCVESDFCFLNSLNRFDTRKCDFWRSSIYKAQPINFRRNEIINARGRLLDSNNSNIEEEVKVTQQVQHKKTNFISLVGQPPPPSTVPKPKQPKEKPTTPTPTTSSS